MTMQFSPLGGPSRQALQQRQDPDRLLRPVQPFDPFTGRPYETRSQTQGNNIFEDVFETDPLGRRTLFEGRLGGFNPFQQGQLSNLFEPTFNRFLGQLGQQVAGGGAPDTTFKSFLDSQFNPFKELLRLPQGGGAGDGPLGGRTIFNFGR